MSIYKTPKYLAISLKRFRSGKVIQRRYFGFMQSGGGKIEQDIRFPLKNLDLTSYVLNSDLPNYYFQDDINSQS